MLQQHISKQQLPVRILLLVEQLQEVFVSVQHMLDSEVFLSSSFFRGGGTD